MSIDLLIDRNADKDLLLAGGDLQLVSGLEAAAQRLHLRLSMQKGEWFLDTREGIPWREQVLVRGPDVAALSAIFRERIASAPEVVRLAEFALDFDAAAGLLSLTFRAIVEEGEVVGVAEGSDLDALLALLLEQPAGSIA